MIKVLIVMGGFFPGNDYGGPPVSICNLCKLLSDTDEEVLFYIVTRNHDLNDISPYDGIQGGWNTVGNRNVLYVSDSEYNYRTFSKVADEVCPDLIYLQGLFQSCVLPCLVLAKRRKIPALLAPRGELCAGAISNKQFKKIPYIWVLRLLGLFDGVSYQSTSAEETLAVKKYLHVGNQRIFELPNVPTIPNAKHAHLAKVPGSARLVFISRIVEKKNLRFALELLALVEGNINLDIYGPIEDKAYWDSCCEAVAMLPNNVTVNYCGTVEHERIHEVFAQYDAFVFPTYSENYGHVIAEALAAGCPVIISDQTPWNGVTKARAGWAISLSSAEQYVDAIQRIVDSSALSLETMRENSVRFFTEQSRLDELRLSYLMLMKSIVGD